MIKESHKFNQQMTTLDEERAELYKKSSRVFLMTLITPIVLITMAVAFIPEATFFIGVFSVVIAFIVYHFAIGAPFNHLKHKVREFLLQEFMNIYHPNISYHYQPEKDQVKKIIKSSGLVSCNQYREEDVITGTANDINFYLSEIKLQTSSGKSTTTVFEGIMFKLKIPGRHFPLAQIQSKPGLLKKIFGNFVENKEFGFWYDTYEPEKFKKQLGSFFPFIRHLIQQQKDIRIKTDGEEITILMKSDMKFLDDPKPKLSLPFKNELYYQKIGQQINSLLFIVEAFAGKLDKQEVIERLELKELEYLDLKLNDEEKGKTA